MNLKPSLFSKTLSSSPSSSLYTTFFISYFSTTSHSQNNYASQRRASDEESKNVRVSVWWDFENCNIPTGTNVFKISHMITAAIRSNGIKGPVQITAFGDIFQLSRPNQEALSSTGVNLAHIPTGGKNSADRSLLMDLMIWVSQNPPPAHLFLISGDRDFASILHRLRMNNYNILLASTDTAPCVLYSAASIMWHWNSLVKGENLVGRHFNQPPEGPYGSWYGHYKEPLEDPFSIVEQSSSQNEELSGSESKIRPIPNAVIKQIQNILSLNPKGISNTDLLSELNKSNVGLDKDFYGYKKFSNFLFSMPHILRLRMGTNGMFLVRGVRPKSLGLFPTSSGIALSKRHQDPDLTVGSKSNDLEVHLAAGVDGKTKLPPQPDVNDEQPSRKTIQISAAHEKQVTVAVKQSPDKLQQPSPIGEKIIEVVSPKVTACHLPPVVNDSDKKYSNAAVKVCTSGESSETIKVEEKQMEPDSQDADPVRQKTDANSEAYSDESSWPGLFNRILSSWFKFWNGSPNPDPLDDQSSKSLNHLSKPSGISKVLTEDSFWMEMEAFMDTSRASAVISDSRTRLQMAESLLKEGPSILKSLQDDELLQLVDLLITEKKWVEEYPSRQPPFTLTWTASENSSSRPSHAPNGLSSILSCSSSPSKFQILPENGEKEIQNISHTGVSTVDKKKPTDRLRSEMLTDCQKLLNEVLTEHPEGYNIGLFKILFRERCGYNLDYQRLGYNKLTSLFQIMHGVKKVGSCIFPTFTVSKLSSSDGELSDGSKKDNDSDSPWDELGPVSNISVTNTRELQSGLQTQSYPDYESPISDDEFTDSEGETQTQTKIERQQKGGADDKDIGIMQILDSWYDKNGNVEVKSENIDRMVNSSSKKSNVSVLFGAGSKNKTCLKRRFPKYNFVSDNVGDAKSELFDGMMGNMKKTVESRMQN